MARGFERPPWWGIVALVVGTVAFAVLLPLALNQPEPPSFAAPAAAATTEAEPIRVAVVGDSISEANSDDFDAGDVGDGSWVRYAAGDGLAFAGGHAVGGETTGQLLDGVTAVPSDVLVMLAGTNDSGQRIPFDTTAANLQQIAATVGAPRVVLSAIPPRDEAPEVAVEFNARLQEFAASQGWEFIDPMSGVRDGDRYATGMTEDGIHPTSAAAQIIGAAVHAYLIPAAA